MVRNPKKLWNEVKDHEEETAKNFMEEDMFIYVQKLYNIPGTKEMTHGSCNFDEERECFTFEEVKKALKHMKNGKACNSSAIYVEMLKWLPQEGLAYVKDILNQAYHYGFPLDWQDMCIKTLHKGGHKNELRNYCGQSCLGL